MFRVTCQATGSVKRPTAIFHTWSALQDYLQNQCHFWGASLVAEMLAYYSPNKTKVEIDCPGLHLLAEVLTLEEQDGEQVYAFLKQHIRQFREVLFRDHPDEPDQYYEDCVTEEAAQFLTGYGISDDAALPWLDRIGEEEFR